MREQQVGIGTVLDVKIEQHLLKARRGGGVASVPGKRALRPSELTDRVRPGIALSFLSACI